MIKFSIFGFGHIGKIHVTIANEYPRCSVVAVVDSNPEVQNDILFPQGAKYYKCIGDFLNVKVEFNKLSDT